MSAVLGASLVWSGVGSTAVSAKTSSSDRATAALKVIARAIDLKASDLPGWSVAPNTGPGPGPSYKKEVERCEGTKYSAKLAQVSSPDFTQGGVELSSNVNIVATDADAQHDLAGIGSPKVPGCLARAFVDYAKASLVKQFHAKLGKVSSSFFRPGDGLSGAVGIQIGLTVTATSDGATYGDGIYFSSVDFVVGRAEITFTLGEQGQRISVPIEPSLLNTLRQRATAVASL